MSKSHPSPKQLRITRKKKAAENMKNGIGDYLTINNSAVTWVFNDDTTMTTTSFAFEAAGFVAGDIITFSAGPLTPTKKMSKKTHPARRRRAKKDPTYVVTSVSDTTMTYQPQGRTKVKKVSADKWKVWAKDIS